MADFVDRVYAAGLGIFVILAVAATYFYYSSIILGAETSYGYYGVCSQYYGPYNYTTHHYANSSIYNATQCSALHVRKGVANGWKGGSILLIVIDFVFMSLYWITTIREQRIYREAKKTRKAAMSLIVAAAVFLMFVTGIVGGHIMAMLFSSPYTVPVAQTTFGYTFDVLSASMSHLLLYLIAEVLFVLLYWLFVIREERKAVLNGMAWKPNLMLLGSLVIFAVLAAATASVSYMYAATFSGMPYNSNTSNYCGYFEPGYGGTVSMVSTLSTGSPLSPSLCPAGPQLAGLRALGIALTALFFLNLVFGLLYWGVAGRGKYVSAQKKQAQDQTGSWFRRHRTAILVIIIILLMLFIFRWEIARILSFIIYGPCGRWGCGPIQPISIA